jgi:predicted aspartyl protease
MEPATMGKVMVAAKLENLDDVSAAKRGALPPEQIRTVEVADALVDTGATFLSLPRSLIQQLGLIHYRTRRAKTSGGIVDFNMYGVVRLTVQGRDCFVEVAELPDECPVLIGQLPLEALDFLIDPIKQRLVGNPDHNGEHMMDLY